MEGLNPQQYEQALGLTTEILRRMHKNIGHSPHDVGQMANAFFAPPGDAAAADQRVIATALALALNPQTPPGTQLKMPNGEAYPIASILKAARYDTNKVFQQAQFDDSGYPYTGGGWSKEERQALGRDPGAYELSPGDHQAYQRSLNHHTLSGIRQAVERIQKSQASPHSNYRVAVAEKAAAEGQLRDAIYAYNASYGQDKGKNASSFFGSTYPQHRNGGAVADALNTPGSPVAWFVNGLDFYGQMAANALMGQPDPGYRASVANQGWDQWKRPSPHDVPSGSPEQRDRYIAEARQQADQIRAPWWSLHKMRKTGEPPSYIAQGAANLAYNLADPSNVVSLGAGKALHLLAKAAAPRLAAQGLGGMAGYATRLAGKTLDIASGKPVPLLLRESGEEMPLGAALQGAATLGEKDRPAFFPAKGQPSAWQGGIENRPDIKAALLAEGVDPNDRKAFEEYYDKQEREAQAAVSDLAYKNAQSPYHASKRGLGMIGSKIGEVQSLIGQGLLQQSQGKSDPKYFGSGMGW